MNLPVRVSPELFEVLSLFDEWRERTHGALDASAETISQVWKKAAAQKRLPSETELHTAVASVQRVHWKLDRGNRTAAHTSDAPLALNSFVKSYIAGRAADAALGASRARAIVVNIGGDLVVRGAWSEGVDVSDPKSDAENAVPIARLVVVNRTIAPAGITGGVWRSRGGTIAYRRSTYGHAGGRNYQLHRCCANTCGCGRLGHGVVGTHASGKRSFSRLGARRGIYAGEKGRRKNHEWRVECAGGAALRANFNDAANGFIPNGCRAVQRSPMERQI